MPRYGWKTPMCFAGALALMLSRPGLGAADDPPALNPFGPRPVAREDARPGYVEMSNGEIFVGQVHLTRDHRLKIYDADLERQREIPLRVVKQVEAKVKKEWIEKEWRFKELANDEKYFTGRTYPVREYLHTITLEDGRTISGPLSGIVYVKLGSPGGRQPGMMYPPEVKVERVRLHKRDKGPIGSDLESLRYVKSIKLGEKASAEGRRKAQKYRPKPDRAKTTRKKAPPD